MFKRCLVLGLALVTLCGCGGNKESIETGEMEIQEAGLNESTEDGVSNESVDESSDFWYKTYTFPEDKRDFNLPIRGISSDNSITVEFLNNVSDEITHYLNVTAEVVSDMSEIVDVYDIREGDERLVVFKIGEEEVHMYIKNYSDTPKNFVECLDNGWWYIEDGYDRLGFNTEEFEDFKNNQHEYPYIEYILDNLGKPTYIGSDYNEHSDEYNSDSIYYNMVWEYNDFSFVVCVNEMVMPGYDSILDVFDYYYYPNTSWSIESDIYYSMENLLG